MYYWSNVSLQGLCVALRWMRVHGGVNLREQLDDFEAAKVQMLAEIYDERMTEKRKSIIYR